MPAPTMYLAAHGLYGTYRPLHHRYGNLGGGATDLGAAGTIYPIDVNTGAATVFAVIQGQQTMTINPFFSSGLAWGTSPTIGGTISSSSPVVGDGLRHDRHQNRCQRFPRRHGGGSHLLRGMRFPSEQHVLPDDGVP